MDRAQRRVLAEAARLSAPWGWSTTAACFGEPDLPDSDDHAVWCVFDLDEDDPPLASGMFKEDAAFIAANNPAQFLADCDEYDALVAEVAGHKKTIARMQKVGVLHNHLTRDIKPYGVCPGCDHGHDKRQACPGIRLLEGAAAPWDPPRRHLRQALRRWGADGHRHPRWRRWL